MYSAYRRQVSLLWLPNSEILGSKPVSGSPWLFAAAHVLLRLSTPRHPPYALSSLTVSLRHVRTLRIRGSIPEPRSASLYPVFRLLKTIIFCSTSTRLKADAAFSLFLPCFSRFNFQRTSMRADSCRLSAYVLDEVLDVAGLRVRPHLRARSKSDPTDHALSKNSLGLLSCAFCVESSGQ